LISVLIDTYNHERFIEQAIVSVLDQDFPERDREILVVDDGSTDRTPAIIRKFEPRVRFLRKTNGGQASAFNLGIPACKGEIVAFLDGDDWWEPGKLSVVASEFESHPEIGAIGHGLFEADEHGVQLYKNVPDRRYIASFSSIDEIRRLPELRSFLGTSRFACRVSVLRKILPLPEDLVIEADELLATLAVAVAGALVLNLPLTNYRIHTGNLFQFSEFDPPRLARKQRAFQCLALEYPRRLASLGIAPELAEPLARMAWLEAERLRLTLGDGWSWHTFRAERIAFRQSRTSASFSYCVFHAAVLVAALLLPPRIFYKGRRWYAERGLALIRGRFAPATPAPSLVVRKATRS